MVFIPGKKIFGKNLKEVKFTPSLEFLKFSELTPSGARYLGEPSLGVFFSESFKLLCINELNNINMTNS
jgi:hypothetical protein